MYCDACGAENRDEARYCHGCGADVGAQRVDVTTPGELVMGAEGAPTVIAGRYIIEAELGRGGMGIVYKAIDRELDRPVALKVLHPRVASRPEAVKQLREEALAAMRITHPNIVRLHNFENTPEAKYLLMEYVPGQSLAKMLHNGLAAGFTERDVVRIALQVCDALIAAHKAGVIHRDIKPSNILITPEGHVKIVDLGIAHAEESGQWPGAAGGGAGTPTYMAPEQFNRERVDGRTDVYALGATLYELLASHPPFVGSDMKDQHLHEIPEPIPGVSDWMNEIVLKCLEKAPRDRWTGADALRTALEGTPTTDTAVRSQREIDNEPEWRRVSRERDRRDQMLRAERGKTKPSAGFTEGEIENIVSDGQELPQVIRPQRPGALAPAGPVTPFGLSAPDVSRPGARAPVRQAFATSVRPATKNAPPRSPLQFSEVAPSKLQWGIPSGIMQFSVGASLLAAVAAFGAEYWAAGAPKSLYPILFGHVGVATAVAVFWGMTEIELRHTLLIMCVGLVSGVLVGLMYLMQRATLETAPLTLLGLDIARGVLLGGALGAALGSARGVALAVWMSAGMAIGGGLFSAMLQAVIRLQGWYPSATFDVVCGAVLLAFGISFGAAAGASTVNVPRDQRMRL